VEGGTARRVNGVLKMEDGHWIEIGGKTGSGDNRYERVAADGSILSSRAINRTASFVFVAGENFFGMITAYVPGEEAGEYKFTSTLALQAFRSLAPAIDDLIAASEARHASPSLDTDGERATEITRVTAPASQVASRP
jgi:hypothetical protein